MLVSASPLTFQMGGNLIARVFSLILLGPGVFALYASWTAPTGVNSLGLVFGLAFTIGGLQALISTHKAVFSSDSLEMTKLSLLGFSRRTVTFSEIATVKIVHRTISNSGKVTDYYYLDLALNDGQTLRLAQSHGVETIREQAQKVAETTGRPLEDL